MKIGIISFHSFSQPGGVKSHVLGLKDEFKKKGIDVKIIVPRRNWREYYGKDVILLGTSFPISFVGSQSDFNINFNPLAIEKTLRREKFDILHLHNFGFPSAFQVLNSPAVDESLNILTFHSDVKGSKFFEAFPVFIYILNKIVSWKIDGVIGVAPLILKIFKGYGGPKAVIPNGIDLKEFHPKVPKIPKFLGTGPRIFGRARIREKKINILFIGRIEERKGLIYLLKAYQILQQKFSNLRLIVVGEGDLMTDCRNYVKENKLKDVVFEGQVNSRRIPSYYATCDIYCSPAIFGESFGMVLLEAMACGKPVVAFANSGYKGILKHKELSKFLVAPKNYKLLAKKLEILIMNPQLRKKIGDLGIVEAKKYSWTTVAEQVLEFYKQCIDNKKKQESHDFSLEKAIFTNKILTKNIDGKRFLDWLKELIK